MDGMAYLTGLARKNQLDLTWRSQHCLIPVSVPISNDPLPELGTFYCHGVEPMRSRYRCTEILRLACALLGGGLTKAAMAATCSLSASPAIFGPYDSSVNEMAVATISGTCSKGDRQTPT
jgi:hypothetical protein